MIAPWSVPESDDPDAQMMAGVREGNLELFNDLVRRYESTVQGLVRHMQGSHLDSEDLTQQVFMKAFCARSTYAPSAKFSTWIFTITRNVVLNSRRQSARRRESCIPLSDWGEDGLQTQRRSLNSLDPSSAAIHLETQQAVQKAIDELGERQGRAIRLVCVEGYAYKEAAEKMGITATAIKSLVHRAKSNLRGILEARHCSPSFGITYDCDTTD